MAENYAGTAGTEVSYRYDGCTNGKGHLCTVSSTISSSTFSYNAMGLVASQMWQQATQSCQERDPTVAAALERRDDDLDRLVDSLRGGLIAPRVDAASVLNAVLVGRFFERLGDHAVHLAGHVAYLVTGEPAIRSLPA